MSPDNIMRSDVLDIVFENRNKDYGAYLLRKNYNKRLRTSLSVVLFLTFVLLIVNQLKTEPIRITEFVISDTDPIKMVEEPAKPKEPEQPKPQPQQVRTIRYTVPIITNEVTEDTMPVMDAVEDAIVGTENKPGDSVGMRLITQQQAVASEEKPAAVVDVPATAIFESAERMPSFPGGIEGLKKYMMKNLMQPDDLEDGQKVVVVAKFIVKDDGTIDEASITKTGRDDLDREVLRVIRKMPRWEPGKQNGKQVSVWFKLPVTFISEN